MSPSPLSPSPSHSHSPPLSPSGPFSLHRLRTITTWGSGRDNTEDPLTQGNVTEASYILGPIQDPPDRPDLAVEVISTSGGIDELEVDLGLGVPEVWFWRDGALHIDVLDGEAHRSSPRSRLLPDLDPDLIVRFMSCPSQTQAVRGLRSPHDPRKGRWRLGNRGLSRAGFRVGLKLLGFPESTRRPACWRPTFPRPDHLPDSGKNPSSRICSIA